MSGYAQSVSRRTRRTLAFYGVSHDIAASELGMSRASLSRRLCGYKPFDMHELATLAVLAAGDDWCKALLRMTT